jgi:hypothetical protein
LLSGLTGSALWEHSAEPEVQHEMIDTTKKQQAACEHQAHVQLVTTVALARGPRSTVASTVVAKRDVDETMAPCQAECGDASPFRDVEIHPIPREEAVAMVGRPTSYVDIMLEGFADVARSVRSGVRRALRRS